MEINQLNELKFQKQLLISYKIIQKLLNKNKQLLSSSSSSSLSSSLSLSLSSSFSSSFLYYNKYTLLDILISLYISSNIITFNNLGLNNLILNKLILISLSKKLFLCFKRNEKCIFIKQIEKVYDSNNKLIIDNKKDFFTLKRYRTVIEYEWKFQLFYELHIYYDNGENINEDEKQNRFILVSLPSEHIFSVITNTQFRPEIKILPDVDVDITWLFQNISIDSFFPTFFINRNHPKCHTPSRNVDVQKAIEYLQSLNDWLHQVIMYFKSEIFPLQIHYSSTLPNNQINLPDMSLINTDNIFNPIVPIFIQELSEENNEENFEEKVDNNNNSNMELVNINNNNNDNDDENNHGNKIYQAPRFPNPEELNSFLVYYSNSIHNKFQQTNQIFPFTINETSPPPLINSQTVNFIILLTHFMEINNSLQKSIEFVEESLRKQLIQAIGKEIQEKDFTDYMIYHTRKLFLKQYQTKPFCYSIRKSLNHSTEGNFSIEEVQYQNNTNISTLPNPIHTFVHHQENSNSQIMTFQLQSAISVSFRGERYIHGYLRSSFNKNLNNIMNNQTRNIENYLTQVLQENNKGLISCISYDNGISHGDKPKYYCGSYFGKYPSSCGSCDGYCGPSNGCQCNSCVLLNPDIDLINEISIKCPKGHLMKEVGYQAGWICDATSEINGCATSGTQVNSDLFLRVIRYRCNCGCDFDYCYNCFHNKCNTLRRELLNKCPDRITCPLGHTLELSSNKNNWFCDNYKELDGCDTMKSLSSSSNNGIIEQNHIVRWRCSSGCDFDYCGKCYKLKYQEKKYQYSNNNIDHNNNNNQKISLPISKLIISTQAKQFSNFIVLLGRITSSTTFEPKYGMILQNKDSIEIPLNLETIPSLKEFNEIIYSLSPEQQNFLKAYRSMQLESTLFGVCIIQIKPLLEKVLNLPDDSLRKEIELTENILELFTKYQIPSGLFSYDGDINASVDFKVDYVKKCVQNIYDMIEDIQKKEIQERKQVHDYVHTMAIPMRIVGRGRGGGGDGGGGGRGGGGDRGRSLNERDERGGGSPTKSKEKLKERDRDRDRDRGIVKKDSKEKKEKIGKVPNSIEQNNSVSKNSSTINEQQQQQQQTVNQENKIQKLDSETTSNLKSDHQIYHESNENNENNNVKSIIEYTQLPSSIESIFDKYDKNGSVCPTIIHVGDKWKKESYESLLSEVEKSLLFGPEQSNEKNKAFTLLDSLTKSGGICIDYCDLHILMTMTHCYSDTLINSIIKENINPIEFIEKSYLLLGSKIHQINENEMFKLLKNDQLERIHKQYSSEKYLNPEKNKMLSLPIADLIE